MIQTYRICRHFGICGGCLHQDIPYAGQLSRKAAWLKDLFQDYWRGEIPIIPSPVLLHYRNKIDPGFALKRYEEPPPKDYPRETLLGFKQRRGWRWPLDIEECLIGPEGVDRLVTSVREWGAAAGVTAYDSRRGTGYLRNLLVRDGKRTGERMVVLITAPGALPEADAFVASAVRDYSADSIFHGEFSGMAEVATAEKLTVLHGKAWIEEKLCLSRVGGEEDLESAVLTPRQFIEGDRRSADTLHFRVSPLSFFQTNPLAAERLYGLVRTWVGRIGPGTLYDLYGGAGGIAFSCAGFAGNIVSVENVAAASEDGRVNAARNQIENVSFVTDTVRGFTKRLWQGGGMPTDAAVVMDPPRSGMHPKSIARLLEMRPGNLLYVSCNPVKLREELGVFSAEYEVEELSGVDMFPHTPHVEVVASLVPRQRSC